MKKQKIISIIVTICLLISVLCSFSKVVQAAENNRYIVLTIDRSGKVNFDFTWIYGSVARVGKNDYEVDTAVAEVKVAAANFLDSITDYSGTYVAIVQYSDDASVVCDFTDDTNTLKNAVATITGDNYEEESDGPNIAGGLQCAKQLLDTVTDKAATKNIVICNTGLTTNGDYSYDGHYKEDDPDIPDNWENGDTEVRLYAYANAAYAVADEIKSSGVYIYSLGVFNPIESTLPSEGRTLVNFFRQTAQDISSGDGYFFVADEHEEIPDMFEDCENAIDESYEITYHMNGYEETLNFEHNLDYYIKEAKSTTYNPELAYIMMAIAGAAYEEDDLMSMYDELGFSDTYVSDYYDPDMDDTSARYSFGAKKSGSKTLILIDVAGTKGALEDLSGEWRSNFDMGLYELNFGGLHSGFSGAADEILEELEDFINDLEINDFSGPEDENVIYAVTGHSRGAAVANLVAATLIASGVPQNNLYGYNFACPDVANLTADNWNPDGKYDGIWNISNCKDPVSMIPGIIVDALTIANISNTWGKFGNSLWFSEDWADIRYNGIDVNSHHPKEYIAYLKQLRPVSEMKTYFEMKANIPYEWDGKILGIFCPVDVEVFDASGNCIASVIDGEIAYDDADFPGLLVFTDGEQKIIYIPENGQFTVRLIGTDSGEMSFAIATVADGEAEPTETSAYQNVELYDGKVMEWTYNREALSNEKLYVLDEEGNKTAVVSENGSENTYDPEAERKITQERVAINEAVSNADESKKAEKNSSGFWLIFLIIIIAAVITFVTFAIIRKKTGENTKIDKNIQIGKDADSKVEKSPGGATADNNAADKQSCKKNNYCTRCGSKLKEGTTFCTKCGHRLK